MRKTIIRQSDRVIMLAVFAMAAIYIWSFFTKGAPAGPMSKELIKAARMYFVQVGLEEIVFSSVLLWKAYRLSACALTKIATWAFAAMCLMSFIYSTFGMFSYYALLTVLSQIMIWLIVLLFIAYIIRELLNKKNNVFKRFNGYWILISGNLHWWWSNRKWINAISNKIGHKMNKK